MGLSAITHGKPDSESCNLDGFFARKLFRGCVYMIPRGVGRALINQNLAPIPLLEFMGLDPSCGAASLDKFYVARRERASPEETLIFEAVEGSPF